MTSPADHRSGCHAGVAGVEILIVDCRGSAQTGRTVVLEMVHGRAPESVVIPSQLLCAPGSWAWIRCLGVCKGEVSLPAPRSSIIRAMHGAHDAPHRPSGTRP
jgi:hypothetical protein